jgi:hypothetical protein
MLQNSVDSCDRHHLMSLATFVVTLWVVNGFDDLLLKRWVNSYKDGMCVHAATRIREQWFKVPMTDSTSFLVMGEPAS